MSFGTLLRKTSTRLNLRRSSLACRERQTLDVQSTVRTIPGHKCSLPNSEEQINYVISGGFLVLLRRKIRKWLTVSPSHPDSKINLKSSAQMHREETRHLTRHLNMIHPFSRGRFLWEMLMIPVLAMLFYLIPLELSMVDVPWYRLIWKLVLDVLSFIDIILFFFSGYYDVHKHVVVMNASLVAKRYLCSFFIFDVASSVPYCFLIQVFFTQSAQEYQDYHKAKLLMLLKLVRMPTLTRYFSKFSTHMNLLSYHHIKFVNFILWMYILIVWSTSIIVGMTEHFTHGLYKEDEEPVTHMENTLVPGLMMIYDIVRGFMTVGATDTPNISTYTMVLNILALLFGSALNVVILAKVVQVFQRRIGSRNKYASFMDEISEYMKYKELPTRLREKVFNYVEFKFQRYIFKEEEIIGTLSPRLKQDILMHTCETMIQTVEFFKDLPTSVMLRLVTKLRSELYLPNDVIVMAGYSGNAMYFIYTGTVAIYTKNGKEICHLDDGSHFGEIALVYNEPRVATVVAMRECKVFKLSRKDFQEAIEPFPELNKKIRELAMTRMEKTMKMTQDTQSLLTYDENVDDAIYTPTNSSISDVL